METHKMRGEFYFPYHGKRHLLSFAYDTWFCVKAFPLRVAKRHERQ